MKHPTNIDFANFIGRGASIKGRARLAIVSLFLVILPIYFLGVLKTQGVSERMATLSEYEDFWRGTLEAKNKLKDLAQALAVYNMEQELDLSSNILESVAGLKVSIRNLMAIIPKEINTQNKGYLESLVLRLDGLIKRSLANMGSLAPASLHLLKLEKELDNLEKKIKVASNDEKIKALGVLSTLGRDQLLIFLVLIFLLPIFVGFIPHFIVRPLSMLKQLALKIESGRLKEVAILGRDELALLAQVLQAYFHKQEELDQKKSSKIFEMRNLLRAVINRVLEPVFIIDKTNRINYTNEAAFKIVGLLPHQIEGTSILDCIYCTALKKSIEKAFKGDISEDAIKMDLESSEGRSTSMMAKIGLVRNRDGEVSRVVIVFLP